MDTIVALSSGAPPAAIAVIRISGPDALAAASAMVGDLPPPRHASLRAWRDVTGGLLDRGLVLVFPGPGSATGEDLVELHGHGGRAVTAAVSATLTAQPGVRLAEPGEFTRRALLNGRIDLAQAEGLADLLEAETEGQRRAALMASEGRVSRAVHGWLARIADMSAQIEATLDYAEEGDLGAESALLATVHDDIAALRAEIAGVLASPPVERLRDGVRVVIAGPPNSGKSTLLNLLAQRDAAIVSPHAGTTRDRVETPARRNGVAYLLTDTAGLHDTSEPVERIGVELAEKAIASADLLLWAGDEPPPRADALWLHMRADLAGRALVPPGRVSAVRQDDQVTIERIWQHIEHHLTRLLPKADDLPLRERQRQACAFAMANLLPCDDPLIMAERLRIARTTLGSILGIDATESMLDALFSRFCLGK